MAVTGAVKGGMWSRPLHAIGKEEGDLRPGLWRGRNAVRRALLDVGVARMVDGTELHLLYCLQGRNRLAASCRPVINRPLVVKETREVNLFYGFTRGRAYVPLW